jgi:hypothetical protein
MAIDTATLGDCVGKYRASFGVLEAVLKGGHLEAQTTGQPTFTIFANATDTFFYKMSMRDSPLSATREDFSTYALPPYGNARVRGAIVMRGRAGGVGASDAA